MLGIKVARELDLTGMGYHRCHNAINKTGYPCRIRCAPIGFILFDLKHFIEGIFNRKSLRHVHEPPLLVCLLNQKYIE